MLPAVLSMLLAATCPVSPVENPLPETTGPMTGHGPAWVIDGATHRWESAEARITTLWILSKMASGPLHIEGRRLDGDGIARFQDGGVEGTPKDALDIERPW